MERYSTEAVIIGIKNWGEADKIVTLLSKEQGLIKAVAFGCRRPKSTLAGALQLFNVVDIQLGKGEKLDSVRQCTLKYAYRTMSQDFSVMAYGAFVAELVTNLAVENFPQVEMYEKLLEVFGAFGSRNPRIIALAATYQLLEFSGMQLSYDRCIRCNEKLVEDGWFSIGSGGAISKECLRPEDANLIEYPGPLRIFITQLLQLNWNEKPTLSVKGSVMLAAESLMLRYLDYIFGKPLKSLEFIQQLSG